MVPSQTILIVEDDDSIVRLLEMVFRSVNLEVVSTSLGSIIEKLIENICPTLIILDIELPDSNGIELIRVVRQLTNAPILMLSGKNTDMEKVASLNYGADDYVVKPFSVAELIARVQVLLRRFGTPAQALEIVSAKQPTLESNTNPHGSLLYFELDQHRVFIGSQELFLTHKEFQLLRMLFEKKGKVLSRELLLDNIWGINNIGIETRAVDACVSRLRKKIKNVVGQDVIEAISGSGYRLSI